MGDVAMTIPVFNLIANQYPELKIILLTKLHFKPLFGHLNNVSVFPAEVKGKHRGLLGLGRLFLELNKLGVSRVADLHNVLRSRIIGLLFRFAGTDIEIIDKGRKGKKALTSHKDKIFEPLTTTFNRYREVFARLGYPITLNDSWLTPKMGIPDKLQYLFSKKKNTLGIAPFAAFTGKMYPTSLMEEVIAYLNNTGEYQILLFGGGEKEKTITKKWENEYINCTSLVNEVSFEEELAIISNLKAMVAMDSGNGHLSAMFGVPTITLWGITHPYAGFAPFGQPEANSILADRADFPLIPTSVYGNKMPEGYEKVMFTINPMRVVSRIDEICNGD
nr:glycosyltransferase family 9 protein [Eudoraea chungangensis]